MYFAVVFHKDKDSDYGVTVPSLPGCLSSGETIDEATDQIKESIEGYTDELALEGQLLPPFKPLSEYKSEFESEGLDWGIVWVNIDKGLTLEAMERSR